MTHLPTDLQSLRRLDLAHHLPAQQNYRLMEQLGGSRIITRAQGCRIYDAEGGALLDGMSGLWCVNVGYGREELARAAYDQLAKLPYYPLTASHQPAVELAEKLNEWLGDDYIIYYSNSGSEANEVAFKIARQYHQQNGEPSRWKFISRYRA